MFFRNLLFSARELPNNCLPALHNTLAVRFDATHSQCSTHGGRNSQPRIGGEMTCAYNEPIGNTRVCLPTWQMTACGLLLRCTQITVSKAKSQDCVKRQSESVGREVRHSADAHFAESWKNVKQPFSYFCRCRGKPPKIFCDQQSLRRALDRQRRTIT
jgi:hypothetical protein